MTDSRTMPTLPDDATGRLENVIDRLARSHSERWKELFRQLARARASLAVQDLETTANALVLVASLEQELLGSRDISGPLADEFELLFEGMQDGTT